jgi:hypothetical protein
MQRVGGLRRVDERDRTAEKEDRADRELSGVRLAAADCVTVRGAEKLGVEAVEAEAQLEGAPDRDTRADEVPFEDADARVESVGVLVAVADRDDETVEVGTRVCVKDAERVAVRPDEAVGSAAVRDGPTERLTVELAVTDGESDALAPAEPEGDCEEEGVSESRCEIVIVSDERPEPECVTEGDELSDARVDGDREMDGLALAVGEGEMVKADGDGVAVHAALSLAPAREGLAEGVLSALPVRDVETVPVAQSVIVGDALVEAEPVAVVAHAPASTTI